MKEYNIGLKLIIPGNINPSMLRYIKDKNLLSDYSFNKPLSPDIESKLICVLDRESIYLNYNLSTGPLSFDIEEMIQIRNLWNSNKLYNENFHPREMEPLETEHHELIEFIRNVEDDDTLFIWSGNNIINICFSLFIQYLLRDKACSIYEIKAPNDDRTKKSEEKVAEIEFSSRIYLVDKLISQIENQRLISKEERVDNVNEWVRIVDENKELRVLIDNKVVNVELNYYDNYILRNTTEEYLNSIKIILSVRTKCGQVVGARYLAWRVKELLNQGILKSTIDFSDLKLFEIKK